MEISYTVTIVLALLIVFWVLSTDKKSPLRPALVRAQDVHYTHEQSLYTSLLGQELTTKKDPYVGQLGQQYRISKY